MSGESAQVDLIVHATHEAGLKMGGIGAVLSGLLESRTYTQHVRRTILVGPLDTRDATQMERLTAPRNQLRILYSSHHSIDLVDARQSALLRDIEERYGVKLLYGARVFGSARHEVLLVDPFLAQAARVNAFKAALYHRFGIQSDRYESDPEYSQHINAAEPAFEALQAVTGATDGTRFIIAHEFMGLPLCYSAIMRSPGEYRTIFYGHEVATVRSIVESYPGHDTMFYNVLERAMREGHYLEQVFGDQSGFFKHALIRPAASSCDNVFAVGDSVVNEMRFLGRDWAKAHIDLVYNGVPSAEIALEDKQASHNRLRAYSRNLLGYRPDYVFTHVTRFVPSKGLWRDIRVMEHLDPLLKDRGKRAVLFVLSTVIPAGRPANAVLEMEARYGWPVRHHATPILVDGASVPDLISHEVPFYRAAERFNQRAHASRIVLVNQFGWSPDRCGRRMPPGMTFGDIRRGTDAEFGQSIYEPFGIAQLEPLSAGALCVVSNICGCVGFVRRTGGEQLPNLIIADYTDIGQARPDTDENVRPVEASRSIGQAERDRIESVQAEIVALKIADRLPTDAATRQRYIETGYSQSRKLSWEVVARDYLLPGLRQALHHRAR